MRRSQRQGRQERPEEQPAPSANDRPEHPDAIRRRLAERLARLSMEGERPWRHCSASACRRHRACIAPGVPCWVPPPERPPLTPEEQARENEELEDLKAQLRAQVDARLREEEQ